METVLVTGGSGFLGELLIEQLLSKNYKCINIDLESSTMNRPNLINIKGDIRDENCLKQIFCNYKIKTVYHCAAILAHAVKDKRLLWSCNVDGTQKIADYAKKYGVEKIVFISSNCIFGENKTELVSEDAQPCPIEIYGFSKLEGENILLRYKEDIEIVIIRCPTIIDAGRLGLLSILFEFIDEGRKIWMVGSGDNRYQFIYAKDLVEACLRVSKQEYGTNIFNVGSDDVLSFKDVYDYVIKAAGSNSKIACLPKSLTIQMMKIAYGLKVSPLGPYQYRMIAENFIFDTQKIKKTIGWKPTLKNEEMLYKAYEFYKENKNEIKQRSEVSAHKQQAKMGVIRLLKWLS